MEVATTQVKDSLAGEEEDIKVTSKALQKNAEKIGKVMTFKTAKLLCAVVEKTQTLPEITLPALSNVENSESYQEPTKEANVQALIKCLTKIKQYY